MLEVYILKDAEKELQNVPDKLQNNIKEQIKTLAYFPNLRGCKKISGTQDTYRLRAGKYRILFKAYPPDNAIIVVKIGRRGKVYRNR